MRPDARNTVAAWLIGAAALAALPTPSAAMPQPLADARSSDAGTETESQPAAEESAAKSKRRTKRDVPDYDGRGEGRTSAGDVVLWIPRVILSPLFAVSEYVLRAPLGALATSIERHNIPKKISNALSFGTDGRVGIYPTGLIDFGLRPSIGLSLFSNHGRHEMGRLRVKLAWGGNDWWMAQATERIYFVKERGSNTAFSDSNLGFEFLFLQRPDHPFHGLGNDTPSDRTRYFRQQLGGRISSELVFGHLDGVALAVKVEESRFGPGHVRARSDDRLIDQVFDVSDPTQVPGFDGHLLGTATVGFHLDTRQDRPAPGSGLRLEASADLGTDFGKRDIFFARYGGELALFWDLNGYQRVLSLRQAIRVLDPLAAGDVPFTELLSMGGREVMRGFQQDRYLGSSSTVTTLQYTYPIWLYLDGMIFAEVGNVFGSYFEGFSFQRLAMSFGFGVRSNADRDSAFALLFALGTAPFDAAEFRAQSFRFVLGVDRGF
jgi:hypothetical protein